MCRRDSEFIWISIYISEDTLFIIQWYFRDSELIWIWIYIRIQGTSSDIFRESGYLTIRPVARKGYGSIAHEANWPVALEGEGSNCFSITQLVGQKRQ